MKTCEAPLPSPVKVKFDPLFKFYPIVLAFLEKEGEILLVVFWIRTRATSRVFPVKVQTVKVKPERWPMYYQSWYISGLPVKHVNTAVHKDLPLGRVQRHLNNVHFFVIFFGPFYLMHAFFKSVLFTSDHIPEPEFQPPIDRRVFNLGFLCFKLLNLDIIFYLWKGRVLNFDNLL